ncbi:MAG: MFS transporter [Tannerella sp.]|jgi:EmrB/QacA subfamily drug resistance transporter|nr:MFS transporter [Tannerella sp.]
MNGRKDKNSALIVVCLAAFLVPFMGSAINLALPQIGKALTMNAISLSWIATSYLIATAILQVPFARFADLVGRKKVFLCGLALYSLGNFLSGVAPSALAIILSRTLAGVGSAMIFGTSMAILSSVFPPNERGKAFGINTAVVYFALASGPFLGGMIIHYLSWQSLFIICGILGASVVVCGIFCLKGEWIEAKGERFDYVGSVIYAVGLFSLIFGFSRLPETSAFLLIAGGLLAFAGFIFYELKHHQPVFNLRIFSGNRTFSLSSVSALINYASISAIAFLMSLYLQYVRGFNAQDAGLVLISQAIIQSLVSLYAGRLSDRLNPSMLATAGMGVSVIGLVGLIFVTVSTPVWALIALLVVLGAGFGLFSSPNANVIMGSVEKKYLGQASATMGTMRLTGQAFSMGIAMMAISLFVGNKVITVELIPDFMKSMRITFLICAALCIAGTYASSFRTARK